MQKARNRISLLAICIMVVGLHAAQAVDDPVIAPYFVQWGVYDRNYHVTNLPAHLITHIHYAFANPVYSNGTDTGWVASYDPYADFEKMYPGDTWDQPLKGNINQLIKLKERYPHIKTLLSVGGWTLSDDFSDIAASANARLSFAQSCVTWITNYGFNGIDLDWEYPVEGGEGDNGHRPNDDSNYVLLLQAIREQFDTLTLQTGESYLLTVATPCSGLTNRFDLAGMCTYLDWFNIMTYDMAGSWDSQTGHNAPLYGNPAAPNPALNVATSINLYLSNGVPANQLVMGLPFYGRGFANTVTNDNGLFQPFSGASAGSWEAGMLDFKDLLNGTRGHAWLKDSGFTHHYDDIAKVPFLYNPLTQVFVTYDDTGSIALKSAYAREQGLAGVMYWSADSDTADALLQNAIYRELYPPSASSSTTGFALGWQAWTGQVYSVEQCTDLPHTQWTPCTTLVNQAGTPVTSITGHNARVILTDTNTPSHRYYRVMLQSP